MGGRDNQVSALEGNGLTAGQIERFAYLMKECGDIYTACARILIDGWNAPFRDGEPDVSNKEALECAIARAKAANTIMMSHEDIDTLRILSLAERELLSIKGKLRYS